VNVLPTLFSGMLAQRFGNYRLILCGMGGMFFSAIGMTVALVTSMPVLAIVFTASYVAVFGSTLGALAWVVMAELFPNDLRASGTSVCVFCSWVFNLAVGVAYPYIAAAFGHFCFVPFIGSVAIFFWFTYSMVPDTSGKTCDEIQQEFRKRRMMKIEQLTGRR
jgi:MFS family permease